MNSGMLKNGVPSRQSHWSHWKSQWLPYWPHWKVFILCVCPILLTACSSEPRPDRGETEKMVSALAEIRENMSVQNPFANTKRLAHFQSRPEPDQPFQRFQHLSAIGQEQLYAGLTEEAIETFYKIEELLESEPDLVPDEVRWLLYDLIALSWLRLGEQVNCIENPTSASCILPIRGEGVHLHREGSERAIYYYEKILKSGEGSLNTVWLLNIAYMTLGQYPESVPEPWRVPVSAFETGGGVPFFNEIAAGLGLDVVGLSGGSIVDDFTGNGYLDIVTSSWSLKDQVRFFVNNGDGTFSDKTGEYGLTGISGGLNMVHADYTNNGYPDIYLLRGAWQGEHGRHPNSLLRNNGDGTFTDVTFSAGVSGEKPTQTASWGDFNNNGRLDLLVGYESEAGEHPAQLFMNNGDGTFRDVAAEKGLDFTGFVKGVVWGDYNNDGYLDLYVSRLGQPNLLFKNLGPDAESGWRFQEVAAEAGVQEPLNSFPVWFWDLNNNGYLDLFVSAYHIDYGDIVREIRSEEILGSYPRVYLNNGDGTFTDATSEMGLEKVLYTMGSNFGDLDNDGYLDFYVGTGDPDYRSLMPNRMFKNREGRSFQEVTYSGGFGNIQKGHGVSFADLNNNGFQDIYVNMGGALEGDTYQNLLFKNPENENNWITVTLTGTVSNRSALNARITVNAVEDGEVRSIHRHVTSGGSFGGSPLRQEIGIGRADRIESLIVEWPATGQVQKFENLRSNRFYLVTEGSDEVEEAVLATFDFTVQTPADRHRETHDHNGH